MRAVPLLCLTVVLLAVSALGYAADDYLLQPGDILTVSVWKEADLTSDVLVRPDGGISMPLVGEIAAAGHTAEQVRSVIEQRLRKYIPDVTVAVIVKQTAGDQIFVIGKVNRPGAYPINRPVDVMQALSLAGGMTPFAAVNDIRVLRREAGHQITLKFRYRDIEHGRRLQQNIVLQSGDTVVVP
ncbi:MAG TPA: polysaccharide biosynthesis/export family protein [Steroidobacteraceae bacterium]|nr:polysaccharide biosynthesis/export family protein [Steroidobacteraceae bacterium]